MRNYAQLKKSQYIDIVVPAKVMKLGHACELIEIEGTGMTSRECDKLDGASECFYGITSWMGNEGKRGWLCSEH